jgi:GNAT superfamily N-acetyltransferase
MIKHFYFEEFFICYDVIMEIHKAVENDRNEIVELYKKSQASSGIPNPDFNLPDELGEKLYDRKAIERFVAIKAGKIVGHAMIEVPNSLHVPLWIKALGNEEAELIEMGGAFVDPEFSGLGIYSAILVHRLWVIRLLNATPTAATWSQNEHVKKTLRLYGGIDAGRQTTPAGDLNLFVFP